MRWLLMLLIKGIEKAVEHLAPAKEISPDNRLKRPLLEVEDRFENVPQWFTGDNRNTMKDRDALATFPAAMVVATTVKALVIDQMWNEACLKRAWCYEGK